MIRITITAVMILLTVSIAHSQNLVLNGSFSAGTSDWSSFTPGLYTEAQYTETTYGGTSATNGVCEIDAESNARQVITVNPGIAYSFSFRYSRRTGNGAAPNPTTINVKIYDGTGNYIDQNIDADNSAWLWTCYTNTFTPAGNSVTLDFSYAMSSAVTLGAIIDEVTITPVIQTITEAGTACQGSALTLSAPDFTGDPDAVYTGYLWSGPNGFSSGDATITLNNIQPSDEGTYTCIMTLNNCLDLSGSYTLQVAPIAAADTITVCSNELPYNWNGQLLGTPGTYTYSTQNIEGCDSTVTLAFYVNNASSSSADTVICDGQIPFLWNGITVNTTGAGAAVYTTQNATGCDSIVTLNVQFDNTALSVDLGPDQVICPGDTAIIEAMISPFGNYTYEWSPSGDNYGPQDQPNIFYYGDTSITLKLTARTPIGCYGTDSVFIEMLPQLFTYANTNDTGFCTGPDTLQLSITGGTVFRWSPGYGLSDSTIANPLAFPGTSTDYTVYIQNDYGCADTQHIAIAVYPAAMINLPDSVTLFPGESYQLSPGTNCLYFQWFPPSGLSADTISNPIAQPEVRTRYFVTGTTEHGCQTFDSVDVLVTGTVIDMPNAFVPGNGTNNIFKPSVRGLARLNMFRIFNRWGEMVFQSTNIDQGWDGSFNGHPQPVGVYMYIIDGMLDNGKPFVKQGNVTLLR